MLVALTNSGWSPDAAPPVDRKVRGGRTSDFSVRWRPRSVNAVSIPAPLRALTRARYTVWAYRPVKV
ncbi:MAG: hypothetical protein HY079_05685 [Elusimicrobia bacterium]|nr:hypothetical protein [Elusimicrobiota bacterium]